MDSRILHYEFVTGESVNITVSAEIAEVIYDSRRMEHGGVNTDGGKSRAAVGDLNNMNATSLGKKGEFKVYDEIWEAAKNAASSAGYKKFLAYAGEKTTHDTDWELYAGYFMSERESIYVHYNSGAGEGVLPADAVVKNIPYNEELDTVKNKPMQSYGENPNTYEGKRGMGSTFRIGLCGAGANRFSGR